LRDIQHAARNLCEFPYAGVKRDQIVPGIRSVIVYPTVIFYRIGSVSIEIVRVVDGRRNLAAFFSADRDD
jgi:plasmid stabilization system protein ParE